MEIMLKTSAPYPYTDRRDNARKDKRVKAILWFPEAAAATTHHERQIVRDGEGVNEYHQDGNPVVEAD